MTHIIGDDKRFHECGCPFIADDESDQVLYDYGVCVCMSIKQVEDLPLDRETYLKLMGRKMFAVRNVARYCEICLKRGEETEQGQWVVEHDDKHILLCKAHMQEFIDGLSDLEQKGGIVSESFESFVR